MAVNAQNETIPASGQTILAPANFVFLLAASAQVRFTFVRAGVSEVFDQLIAGLQVNRLKGWDRLIVQGTAGTTITLFYGYETAREDQTLFQTQIATIAGGSLLASLGLGSPNGPTDHADVAVATGVTNSIIVVNALRKSVTIGSLSTNTPATTNLRVRRSGSVVGGDELQPGTFIVIPTQAALDIFNGDANSQTFWWQELT